MTNTLIKQTSSNLIAQFGNTGFEPQSKTRYTNIVGGNPLDNLVIFLSNLLGIITIVGALFFIVYFFIAAFNWVTGGDDSGKVEKARNKMVQGVLGLVVIVMSYSLIGLIGTIIGIDLINLEKTLCSIVPVNTSFCPQNPVPVVP